MMGADEGGTNSMTCSDSEASDPFEVVVEAAEVLGGLSVVVEVVAVVAVSAAGTWTGSSVVGADSVAVMELTDDNAETWGDCN